MRLGILSVFLSAAAFMAGARQSEPTRFEGENVLDNEFVHVIQAPTVSGRLPTVPITAIREAVCLRFVDETSQGDAGARKSALEFYHLEYISQKNTSIPTPPSSKKPIRTIWVDLKSAPPAGRFELDAVKMDPAHNKVLYENKSVRVVRIQFGPGEQGPIVDKRPRVIILMTDMHAQVALPDGHKEARDGVLGTIYWSMSGRQATINGTQGPLENIVVELKGSGSEKN